MNDYPRVPRYCAARCDGFQGQEQAIIIFDYSICELFCEKSYFFDDYTSNIALPNLLQISQSLIVRSNNRQYIVFGGILNGEAR